MKLLPTIPTFGYETANCYAKTYEQRADALIKKQKETLAGLFASNIRAVNESRAQDGNVPLSKEEEFNDPTDYANVRIIQIKGLYTKSNAAKIFGYVPVLGILSGLERIRNARHDNADNKISQIVRGIFECLGLGALFLLPDIGVTIYRAYKPEEKRSDVVYMDLEL